LCVALWVHGKPDALGVLSNTKGRWLRKLVKKTDIFKRERAPGGQVVAQPERPLPAAIGREYRGVWQNGEDAMPIAESVSACIEGVDRQLALFYRSNGQYRIVAATNARSSAAFGCNPVCSNWGIRGILLCVTDFDAKTFLLGAACTT